MDRLTKTLQVAMGCLLVGLVGAGIAQDKPTAAPSPAVKAPALKAPVAATPLKLYSLNSDTQADPFPAVNPKFFTADSPSVATVDGYLRTLLGFDSNRIWRVVGIQKTAAAGVSKVTAMVSEKGQNAKVQTAVFYVMPDGKHMLAGDAITPFGAEPFAANRATLQAKADGPSRGAMAKDLMLVEFADLQCPHCKDAQATMKHLETDFPKARFVYQSFPLTDIHPYAFQAATYGYCVAQKSQDAYFTYAQAVYDTQSALVAETADATLKAAVTKAGADPTAVSFCSSSEAAKTAVNKSAALGNEVNVDQTPLLYVNGRPLNFTTIPYDTLKQLISFQAGLDGASAAAVSPNTVDLKTK
jgi:protein-disulfide isomerase